MHGSDRVNCRRRRRHFQRVHSSARVRRRRRRHRRLSQRVRGSARVDRRRRRPHGGNHRLDFFNFFGNFSAVRLRDNFFLLGQSCINIFDFDEDEDKEGEEEVVNDNCFVDSFTFSLTSFLSSSPSLFLPFSCQSWPTPSNPAGNF